MSGTARVPKVAMFKHDDPAGLPAPVALLESGLSGAAVRAYAWLHQRGGAGPRPLPTADMADAFGWSVQRAHDAFLELRRGGVMAKRDEDEAFVMLGEGAAHWRDRRWD